MSLMDEEDRDGEVSQTRIELAYTRIRSSRSSSAVTARQSHFASTRTGVGRGQSDLSDPLNEAANNDEKPRPTRQQWRYESTANSPVAT